MNQKQIRMPDNAVLFRFEKRCYKSFAEEHRLSSASNLTGSLHGHLQRNGGLMQPSAVKVLWGLWSHIFIKFSPSVTPDVLKF